MENKQIFHLNCKYNTQDMKHTTIKIKIAEPCRENWDKMLEEERGRFCLSCQKAVVDFSRMTSQDIIHYFEQNAGKKVCGRIAVHQHDSPISNYTKVITPWFNRYVAGFLMALGFYNPSKAQTTNTVTERHMIKGDVAVTPASLSNKKLIINGRVLDHSTKKPIKGAIVSIDGSDIKVTTNKNGAYAITVPQRLQTSALQLVISYPGYNDEVVSTIDQTKETVSVVTKLMQDIPGHMMGDISIEPETPSKEK
jgi:hypothetical protein